jgi:glycosyltransferase involved in cell wall biosynthesis
VLLARAMGRRVMVTPHLGSNWRSQSHPLLRRLSQWALARAQRLALISRTQELEIALPPALPRSLIRNFLPQSVLSSVPAAGDTMPDRLQLIHSSRLSEGKGTFLVVEVCALLRDRGVAFDARITGGADAETMARLHALIAERGLEDRVKVLGRIPEEELLDLLGRSDVLIHLSKIDSYPLIVLEAMACSTVPLVMELAGARDMVETYRGHVVSAATPVEEAAAWLQSLDVPTLRRDRADVAAPVRDDYAWSRAAGALEAALDATVAALPGATGGAALDAPDRR